MSSSGVLPGTHPAVSPSPVAHPAEREPGGDRNERSQLSRLNRAPTEAPLQGAGQPGDPISAQLPAFNAKTSSLLHVGNYFTFLKQTPYRSVLSHRAGQIWPRPPDSGGLREPQRRLQSSLTTNEEKAKSSCRSCPPQLIPKPWHPRGLRDQPLWRQPSGDATTSCVTRGK